MTETEARAALRACVAEGGLEAWIAAQRWEPVPYGVRVIASAGEGPPAVWIVPRPEAGR